jgi:uncharacterized membrane protein
VQPLEFDPRVVRARPSGAWIRSAQDSAHQVSFTHDLDLPVTRGETWLQVASTGGYDVVINGTLVATEPVAPRAALTGPQAPVVVAPERSLRAQMPLVITPSSSVPGSLIPSVQSARNERHGLVAPNLVAPQFTLNVPRARAANTMPELSAIAPAFTPAAAQLTPLRGGLGVAGAVPTLIAYNISYWTHAGSNSLLVRVRVDDGPALVLAQGFAELGDGTARWFGTDATWGALAYATDAALPRNAVVEGVYGDPPFGPLPQIPARWQPLPGQEASAALRWVGMIVAVGGAVIALWIFAAPMCARGVGRPVEEIWAEDAVAHLPAAAFLSFLWLVSYDVRMPADWCYRPWLVACAAVLVLASKLVMLRRRSTVAPGVVPPRLSQPGLFGSYWKAAALLLVVIAGFLVRVRGLFEAPLRNDEVHMIRCAYGVLKTGFPYVMSGSYTKWLATYELVPYPIALSSLLFGPSLFAYRLPPLVFGTFTIGLIGWVGKRIMDWRVGLLAATVYAFLPTPILWSRDCFYPAQESFFALLTVWLFYEAIRTRPLNGRFLTLASISFLLNYLSWEGSGFLLPALFFTVLIFCWDEFDWMTNKNLWRCVMVVSVIVVLQLCYRALVTIPDYLGVVYDLSEVSSPSPAYLHRLVFDPLFYARELFFADYHFVLSLVALAGLIFAWRNPAVRYLVVTLAALEVLYTCALPFYSERYSYNSVALLVLAGVTSFFALFDRLGDLRPGAAGPQPLPFAGALLPALIALLVLGTNPFVSKLYRLSATPQEPPYFARLGAEFKEDFRITDLYASAHFTRGDAVITQKPDVFDIYAEKPLANYSINTLLARRIYYDAGYRSPRYTDKRIGVPSITSLEQLQDIVARCNHTWITIPPGAAPFNSPDVQAYLLEHARVVVEGTLAELIVIEGVPAPSTAGCSAEFKGSKGPNSLD